MTILSPQDYSSWDSFVRRNNGSFLQSSVWPTEKFFIVVETTDRGEARETGVDAENISAGCKVEERTLWLGKVVWLIRRPLVSPFSFPLVGRRLVDDLVDRARERGDVVMIRIQWPLTNDQWPMTNDRFLVIRPKFLFHVQDPETTLMVDLSHSAEELMREMHEKTRYNIRLAERRGVVAREGTLDEFYSLYQETNRRKGLRGFSRAYFERLVMGVWDDGCREDDRECARNGIGRRERIAIKVLTASYDNTPCASAFLVCFGDTVTYLFGGTSDNYRSVMAPHALHWECMKWAQAKGYRWYDWWGIQNPSPVHTLQRGGGRGDWDGITRFKKGFTSKKTGRVVEYGETVDVVVDRLWYGFLAFVKRVLSLQ